MIFYGIHPVTEALRAERPLARIITQRGKDNPGIEGIRALSGRRGVREEQVSDLARLCNAREHQGVAAEIPDERLFVSPEAALAEARSVMLDSIQDPHNFGASLRVCEVFGFTTVFFQKGNSSGLTPAAIKASAGAAFHLKIARVRLNRTVQQLQDSGSTIFALDGRGSESVYDVALPARFCLVVGAEHKGVRFAIRRLTDAVVRIPMSGCLDSLNLSCALSVALSEFRRRLGPEAPVGQA
jgi:23S rRNA (guanosine2251-2'-O)-methyltransferase